MLISSAAGVVNYLALSKDFYLGGMFPAELFQSLGDGSIG